MAEEPVETGRVKANSENSGYAWGLTSWFSFRTGPTTKIMGQYGKIRTIVLLAFTLSTMQSELLAVYKNTIVKPETENIEAKKAHKSHWAGVGINLLIPGLGLCYVRKYVACALSSLVAVGAMAGIIGNSRVGLARGPSTSQQNVMMALAIVYFGNFLYSEIHTHIAIYRFNQNIDEPASGPANGPAAHDASYGVKLTMHF